MARAEPRSNRGARWCTSRRRPRAPSRIARAAASRWISATRRSCRTCWPSPSARRSTSPTTIAPTTTSSRCPRRGVSISAAMPRDGRKSIRFDRPGIVRVFCEIHSHMNAFILVFNHRFFTVSDADGRYQIDGVPPGHVYAGGVGRRRHSRRQEPHDYPGDALGRDSTSPFDDAALVAHEPHLPGERDARDRHDRRRGLCRRHARHARGRRRASARPRRRRLARRAAAANADHQLRRCSRACSPTCRSSRARSRPRIRYGEANRRSNTCEQVGADLLVITGRNGIVLARGGEPGLDPSATTLRRALSRSGGARVPAGSRSAFCRSSRCPSRLGSPSPTCSARSVWACASTQQLAGQFKRGTHSEIAFVLDGRVRAATLPAVDMARAERRWAGGDAGP